MLPRSRGRAALDAVKSALAEHRTLRQIAHISGRGEGIARPEQPHEGREAEDDDERVHARES